MTPTKSVRLNARGVELLREVAGSNGMTPRQFLEALMHFAISQEKRPGSWEAQSFDPVDYRDWGDEPGLADRWF